MDSSTLGVELVLSVARTLGYLVLAALAVRAITVWAQAPPADGSSRRLPESDLFEPIKQTDPAFSWETFRARVRAAYDVVQRARMVKQPNIAREWVTPTQFVGLENEAAYAERADVDRTVAPIRVTRMTAARVRSDGSHFFVDVRIVAETTCLGRRTLMNDPAAGILEQEDAPIEIDETWTLCRPIGSTTATRPVEPGRCVNCGAPVDDPSASLCPYCGKALRTADWLVTSIAPTDLSRPDSPEHLSTSQTGAS